MILYVCFKYGSKFLKKGKITLKLVYTATVWSPASHVWLWSFCNITLDHFISRKINLHFSFFLVNPHSKGGREPILSWILDSINGKDKCLYRHERADLASSEKQDTYITECYYQDSDLTQDKREKGRGRRRWRESILILQNYFSL